MLAGVLLLALAASGAAQTSEIDRGKIVFQACRHCHNVLTDARKAGPSLRTLFGKVRLVNGKRSNEHNVIQLITEGYNRMPSYQYQLRRQDWRDLLGYLKTLKARPEVAPVLQPVRGSDEEVLAAGKKHFTEHCAACHEKVATPEEATLVPMLRDGHGNMPAKKDVLDDAALFSLISYLRTR